jgi:hypothetical protein
VDAVVDQGAKRGGTAAREARSSQSGGLREAADHLQKKIQDAILKTDFPGETAFFLAFLLFAIGCRGLNNRARCLSARHHHGGGAIHTGE